MTDAEALAILRSENSDGGWIGWDDGADKPDWQCGTVTLDGRFTADELRALLHFAETKGTRT